MPHPTWSWPVTATGLAASGVLVAVLSRTPLPGLDPELVLRLPPGSATPFGVELAVPLVLIRAMASRYAAASPASGPACRRAAAGLFLALAAVSGWALTVSMEDLYEGGIRLVADPGTAFRGLGVTTIVGAHAILWLLADCLGRSGRVHGSLAVCGLLVVGSMSRMSPDGLGLVGAVAVAIGALGLPGWRWPVVLGVGVDLRSWLDWVLLGGLWGAMALTVAARFGGGPLTLAAPAIGAALGLWVVTVIRAEEKIGGTPVRPAFFGLAAVVGLAGVAVGGASRPEPASRPYAGEESVIAELESTPPSSVADEPRLRQRIAELGVEVRITGVSPSKLSARLDGVSDPTGLLVNVGRPGRLALREVLGEARVRDGIGEGTLPSAPLYGVVCARRGDCAHYALGDPPLLDVAVAGADVHFDAEGSPFLGLTFLPAVGEQIGAATAARVNQKIAVMLDDVVLSAPMLRDPLVGTELRMQLDSDLDPQARLRRIEAIAATLRSGPLDGDWVVTSIQTESTGDQ